MPPAPQRVRRRYHMVREPAVGLDSIQAVSSREHYRRFGHSCFSGLYVVPAMRGDG
jgi:hypothetical protein